jgi:hypothetical protein
MTMFSKPKLKVRLKEEVGFAGPIYYTIQVKGGDYGRFFWTRLPGFGEMQDAEAFKVATDWCIKNKARFIP